MMKSGNTHAGYFGQLLNAQRARVICAQPRNGFGGSLAQVSGRGDGAKALALRSLQDPVNELALDQVFEEWNVSGSVKQLDEAQTRAQEPRGCAAYGEASPLTRSQHLGKVLTTDHIAHRLHIEEQPHGKLRDALRGLDNLALDRQIHGRDQKRTCLAQIIGTADCNPLLALS